MRRLGYLLGYWAARIAARLVPPRLRKVSPRHDPVCGGPDIPSHPNCRCVVLPLVEDHQAQIDRDERRDRVQRLIMRPMVQRGELIRGGDPATGKVIMVLTEKGERGVRP